MILFFAAVALLFLSALAGAFTHRGSRLAEQLSLLLSLAGCVLGLVAVLLILANQGTALWQTAWPLIPGAALCFKIDPLAIVFILPAFLVTAAGALYGAGYWPAATKPAGSATLRFFYPLLSATILLLLASDNAFLFLVSWECMALSGYFLIITERQQEEAQRAGFIYLAATHTGTLALFALFALLTALVPGPHLPAAASLAVSWQANLIFLLALFGFGLKAGLIPLHIWLPGAHASAPSNVSALMSGVMIKMGIYGIMRITSFFYGIPLWWGETVLAAGLISSLVGVVWAIAQHDIKRLLAYHSVENIGIILLGLGVALIGRAQGSAAMVAIGLGGALLHVINHGLFKALLFLAAGSVIHATGSRRLTDYGGLLKVMPFTGFFFLGGAVAICGLPPLNGFVSEWLVYLGIFHTVQNGTPLLALLAAPSLAMTGGLALLCFTKVFGLSFLGEARTTASLPPHESPRSMLIAMAVLLAACLAIGVAPLTLMPLLNSAATAWNGAIAPFGLPALAPAGRIGMAALVLALVTAAFGLRRYQTRSRDLKSMPTWGCGYALNIARVQYTTSSFAQMIVDFFNWFLRTESSQNKITALLPTEKSSLKTHSPDLFLDLLILPIAAALANAAFRLRRLVQHGILGIYLLYSAVVLCLLLLLASH